MQRQPFLFQPQPVAHAFGVNPHKRRARHPLNGGLQREPREQRRARLDVDDFDGRPVAHAMHQQFGLRQDTSSKSHRAFVSSGRVMRMRLCTCAW